MQCFLRTANPMRVQQQVRSYSAQLALKKRRKQLPWVDTTPTPSVEEAVNNILYNTIQVQPGPLSRHLLNCLVSNEPGVLSRISGIISSRGFNIDSLVVSKTEVQDLSRMTIVLNGKPEIVEQAKKQLEDLVPVWAVLDYSHTKLVERELLLARVSILPPDADKSHTDEIENIDASQNEQILHQSQALSPLMSASLQRQAITELVRLFNGKIVDVSVENLIIELCAKPSRIDAFVHLLKPYGVVEASRSGVMAVARSPVDGGYGIVEQIEEEAQAAVDSSMLPPG